MSEKSSKFKYLGQLLALAAPHWKMLAFGTLALIGGSAVNLAIPEIIRRLLNDNAASIVIEAPAKVGLMLLALFALQAVFFYIRALLFMIVGQKAVAQLRADLYEAIVSKSISFFDKSRTGDLVSRLNSDCSLIQDAVSFRLSVILRYSLQVIVGVILMTLISPRLTITLLVLIPLLVGFSIVMGKKLRVYSKQLQDQLGKSTVIAEETFGGIRVVKSFLQERNESNRYRDSVYEVLNIGVDRARISAFFSSFASFLMNASIVGVLIYGTTLVVDSSLSSGDLTAFMLYGVIVAVSFAFMAGSYGEMLQALGASERVFELLGKGEETQSKSESARASINNSIEFKNVSFSYPARPDTEVLNDISFTINAKSKTALVGPSGSGKSTVVSLLLKLYDPSAGTILIDGKNLFEIEHSSIRSAIAVVPQDPQLFAVSIEENLRYGNTTATQAELEDACRKANILDFVKDLPEGFKTPVGDRGVQLSGGEKQRVAIARAILKKPSLLILDEATSALDSENEFLVQQAIDDATKDITTIVIAHRLSTVKSSEQVLVIDSGKLVQTGTHELLAKQEGLYKVLIERQELFESAAA